MNSNDLENLVVNYEMTQRHVDAFVKFYGLRPGDFVVGEVNGSPDLKITTVVAIKYLRLLASKKDLKLAKNLKATMAYRARKDKGYIYKRCEQGTRRQHYIPVAEILREWQKPTTTPGWAGPTIAKEQRKRQLLDLLATDYTRLKDLADALDIRAESVSRYLAELRDKGKVKIVNDLWRPKDWEPKE